MEKYRIRRASREDLEEIEAIYAQARAFMVRSGNPTQWVNGYPRRQMLEGDIGAGNLYVAEGAGEICGVFLFVIGEDPTYGYMEDGTWASEERYGTIHRIASRRSGVFSQALEFCRGKCPHIRMDTHRDNRPMQHLAEKHGFSRRGIIYVEDGTPRIAYELL